jgi:hypothetical protein
MGGLWVPSSSGTTPRPTQKRPCRYSPSCRSGPRPRIAVCTAFEVPAPLSSGIAPTLRAQVWSLRHEELQEARLAAEALANDAAARLRAAGLDATAHAAHGRASEQLTVSRSRDRGRPHRRGLTRIIGHRALPSGQHERRVCGDDSHKSPGGPLVTRTGNRAALPFECAVAATPVKTRSSDGTPPNGRRGPFRALLRYRAAVSDLAAADGTDRS